MPLSLNEIRERARAFAREWAGETSERAEAQSFWNDFFDVFGVNRRRVAVFEQKARRFSGSKHGRIDVFWPGVMLAEHKSAGVDLDAAFRQATDYFAGIADRELPRFVLVSDFRRFRLHDLDGDASPVEFALEELHHQIGRFGFISGYQVRTYEEQDPVNVQAAERLGKLHDALKAAGYGGHALEVLLVRLLFCLFADDTGIFPRQAFHDLIAQRTSEDGADLGLWLGRLFQVLDTPPAQRQSTLDEQLAELPWVNGRLFEEKLPLADFNAAMRGLLLDASSLDWSRISPAIFGSMFQSVMDAKARRSLGAHYTSEKNILKLIGPLFLDEFKEELERAGNHSGRLKSLHVRLSTVRFLDPACGCGNFLVLAYRELRMLELEVLRRQFAVQGSVLTRVAEHVAVDVDQFYGIEIEEFPAQIAQVAMWLMDHQMNLRVAEVFGEYFARLPLKKSATIVHGNALRIDWNEVVPVGELNFILGNPPFVGKSEQTAAQKADMAFVFRGVSSFGVLDLVAAWYRLAAHSMNNNPNVRTAYVSTNSITQGEQVGVLWSELYRRGLHIHFAHRTFRWSNEARGKAAVHCVIIGLGLEACANPRLFDYQDIAGDPHAIAVSRINPYLVDAEENFLLKRSLPMSAPRRISFGSMPNDGGHLLLSEAERAALLAVEPDSEKWMKPIVGAEEFINGVTRWCLWLVEITPNELRGLPNIAARIAAVQDVRARSSRSATKKLAATPALFGEVRQPSVRYFAIPKTSSESRRFIPMGFLGPDIVASTELFTVPNATLADSGILMSTMHMAWVRTVCGRLKSDFRYSSGIVYNNFPWPEISDQK